MSSLYSNILDIEEVKTCQFGNPMCGAEVGETSFSDTDSGTETLNFGIMRPRLRRR